MHPAQQTARHSGTPVTAGRPVVVGVDASDSAVDAVRWAARHARDIGAELRIVHAAAPPHPAIVALPVTVPGSVAGAVRRRPARSRNRILARATTEAARYGRDVEVSAHAVAGAAGPVLVDASAEADLLVLGSRGRGPLSRSVGMSMAASAHCPVVVIRGHGDPAGPVVVAVDATAHSAPALRYAFTEAARRGTGLVAVHGWDPRGMPAAGPLIVPDVLPAATADLRRGAADVLADLVAPWRKTFPHVTVREWLVDAGPAAAVTRAADGAAMVVVGSRGRGRAAGLLFGSTSQAIMQAAECPVVVVREAP